MKNFGEVQFKKPLLFIKIEPKGEFTIIVEGNNQQEELELSETEIKLEMVKLLNQGMSKSEASQHLAKYTNFSRREIYQLTLIDDI